VIRTILVDDEPPARRKLQHLLADAPDFTLVGEAGSAAEAVERIQHLRPDLVILDIGLPDASGFEVLDALDEPSSVHCLFVTAFDEFALQAFDRHAIDYLLKPVQPSRFSAALERARRLIGAPQGEPLAAQIEALMNTLKSSRPYVRRLLVRGDERYVFVDVDRIDWIEAARNYVCIRADGQTHIQRSTLEAISGKLDPAVFRRISRSHLVNVRRIAEVQPLFHGDQKIVLADGTELTWSRRYRAGSLEDLEHA
jgi:two-component system, LytTR family, response regulator